MECTFEGWPAEGPALLARLATDNTPAFWAEHRQRHDAAVRGPMRALAAALEPEFGPARVFRPQVNRRFRPDVPPYRTDTGCVVTTAGGCVRAVVLSATALSASAGHWAFDGPQLRRFRAAVAGDDVLGDILADVLAGMAGWSVTASRMLVGMPRGYPADHPRSGLLRHLGLQVARSWELGAWLHSAEPLRRVRDAWRAVAPLVDWLDTHVGPADPAPPRPRRPVPAAATDAARGSLPPPAAAADAGQRG